MVQFFGELLITAGIVLILFVGWELWWTNLEADSTQQQAAQEFVQNLGGPLVPQGDDQQDFGPPPVTAKPGAVGQVFGLAFIPRFGPDYVPRPLVEGTSVAQLNTLGLGHYPSTAMPGEAGNFAIAGHRQTRGAVLDRIDTLLPGDRIYIQTAEGYYTYVFRNTEIVLPAANEVLLPVPTVRDAIPEQSILTMTSCNPRFGSEERIIAYSLLESWRPLSAGPPAEIADQVQALAKK
ncbi:class E sortase [Acaricomes phytoseiuli]|nr:class E sortase [Acaricomes phytoseiuli]MCW1248680.1 class E sortase [Acaricomes phytoseiuli]